MDSSEEVSSEHRKNEIEKNLLNVRQRIKAITQGHEKVIFNFSRECYNIFFVN